MTTLLVFFAIGIFVGYWIIAIPKSIYSPKAMWIQSIKLIGKPFTYIENVNAKKFYKGASIPGELTKWDLIDDPHYEKGGLNIYFFLWPFFTVHKWEISYTKMINPGEEKPGDIILKKILDREGGVIKILISRNRKTDHLLFRESYPMLTTSLSTKELANINVITEPILEIMNPAKALYGIADWLKGSISILSAALRGFIATNGLYDLNLMSSEGGSEKFNAEMKKVADISDPIHPGLRNLGIMLFKHTFEDYDPADNEAKKLMDSYTKVTIITQEGEANVITAQKNAEVITVTADAKAYAYSVNQKAITEWKKKYLVKTGLAKTDATGNIIELVPDANTRVGAEAIKELSKLTGTLVLDSGSLNKMFNINPKINPKIKEE